MMAKQLAYESEQYFDPDCVGRALRVAAPAPADEEACHVMIIWAMSQCRRSWKEIYPAYVAAEENLTLAIRAIKGAETALQRLPRIYKRLAFPDLDNFDDAATGTIVELGRQRKALETLLGDYREKTRDVPAPRPTGGRPLDIPKTAAAAYAYCILVAYSESAPTLSAGGRFFELASVVYEGATDKEEVGLEHHCRLEFARRRNRSQMELRRSLREAETQRAAEITRHK
jgi:hypothetical protein